MATLEVATGPQLTIGEALDLRSPADDASRGICHRFRWLGAAGIEILAGGKALLIDPFLTRPSWPHLLMGKLRPNQPLIARTISRAEEILITHGHYDHLMDVPEILRLRGGRAYGSNNVCDLLRLHGISATRFRRITAGDHIQLGQFHIEVLPAEHMRFRGKVFAAGQIDPTLRPPLRLKDYKYDQSFSFYLQANGLRYLIWSSARCDRPRPADILFVQAFQSEKFYRDLLAAVRPKLVIPLHWDDFFRPLSKGLRAGLKPPEWKWPPLQRLDLEWFKERILSISPQITILIPEIFSVYEVDMPFTAGRLFQPPGGEH